VIYWLSIRTLPMNLQSTLNRLFLNRLLLYRISLREAVQWSAPYKHRELTWWIGVALLVLMLTWSSIGQLAGDLGYLAARQLFTTGHPKSTLWLLRHIAQFQMEPSPAQNMSGYILYALHDMEGSEQVWSVAERQEVDDTESDGINMPLFNNLAILRYEQVRIEEALHLQHKAATAAANSALPHYNLGVMLWQQGDLVAARRALREATYIAPAWGEPYALLAFLDMLEGRYATAETYAETAVTLVPDHVLGYEIYLQALLAQDKGQIVLTTLDTPESTITRHAIIDRDRLQMYRALALKATGDQDAAKRILETLFVRADDQTVRHRAIVELRALMADDGYH